MQNARVEKNEISRFRKLRLIILPLLALIILLALVLFNRLYLSKPSSFSRGEIELNGPYKVERVVDGKETKVRLIGIDTPESAAPAASGRENTKEGEIASKYPKKLIEGKNIYLEFDLNYMDQYGRVLAYVYLSDETTMVQEKLLEEGYAKVMTVQPNSKYSDRFLKLQQQARSSKKGFWGSGAFSD